MRLLRALPLLALLACSSAPPPAGSDAARSVADAAVAPGSDAATTSGTDDAMASSSDDAAASPDAPPVSALSCPPEAPFGRAVGQIAPELSLPDCDGTMHSLHALCERDAVWLFELADWCPPCRSFAMSEANRLYDRFQGEAPERFEGWVVVSEDSGFDPATSATCEEIRARYGLHAPVLFDTEGLLQSAFGVAPNEVQIVLGRGAEIRFVGHYAGDEVEAELARALAP